MVWSPGIAVVIGVIDLWRQPASLRMPFLMTAHCFVFKICHKTLSVLSCCITVPIRLTLWKWNYEHLRRVEGKHLSLCPFTSIASLVAWIHFVLLFITQLSFPFLLIVLSMKWEPRTLEEWYYRLVGLLGKCSSSGTLEADGSTPSAVAVDSCWLFEVHRCSVCIV